MNTDIACCRACGSHNVQLDTHAVHDIAPHFSPVAYSYSCRTCGHQTPDRPSLVEAAADVDWCPSTDVRVR